MNSALGNFDSNGIRQNDTQTPENGESLNATMQRLCSNLLSLQETLEKHTNASRVANVSQETYTNSTPVVSEATNDVLNVLDYVSKAEWDHFEGLAMVMLANGATLFELQQRLMGLS